MRFLFSFIFISLITLSVHAAPKGSPSKVKDKDNKTEEKADTAKTDKKDVLKKYTEVITDKVKTSKGFLTIHYDDGKYYMEISDSIMGRDVMVVNRIVKAPADRQKRKVGYPGDHINDEVIRFEKGKGDKVFVRQISYYEHSSDTLGLYKAVKNSNIQPIVATFNLKTKRTEGKNTDYVIDITDYINRDNELFSFDSNSKDTFGVGGEISDASYIDTIKAYPTNIEMRTVKTFTRRKSSSPMSGLFALLFGNPANTPLTYELNSSLILLPKEPMKARYFDPRVGYFAVGYTDFDTNPHGIYRKAMITRWRLEPKPEDREKYLRGELVEPAKPIVIYIDPATPKKWVPYLIQGVNDWQVAFEQAGFKNAIIAKEAPVNDPDWSLEDARHSAIVYKPSDIPNASGPHIHDPRSGEIIETHINWYHNVMQLLYDWYTVQAGAIDPGARKPQFDDELMGQLVRFVSSHEVGHTLGLRHNFGSSHTVPVEKLRDKAWVEANGHTPSIMDYARFNYIAQPEDSISRKGIFPRIGMYDKWAIEWGYRWMPEYKTADAERPHLNQWVVEKLNQDKRYTFGTEDDMNDPRNQYEDLGDNAMLASTYGIKNLKRIVPEILNWTREPNRSYKKASNMFGSVLNQFHLYMVHVTTNVAGVYSNHLTVEQTNVKAKEYVPHDIQKEAVAFLNRELFTYPSWLRDTTLESRTGINSEPGIFSIQSSILQKLLDRYTFDKMIDNELQNGKKAYTVDELFNDIDPYIWVNLNKNKATSHDSRLLQKAYVNALVAMLDKPKDNNSRIRIQYIGNTEASAIARGKLMKIRKKIVREKRRSSGINAAHYTNLLAIIDGATK